MADHAGHAAIPQRRDQSQRITDQVEHAKRGKVGVVAIVPAGGPPVPALVGRDHVIPGFSEREHHLAPAVGEFRKPVQQQEARPATRCVAGFEEMHVEAVDPADAAGADACRERQGGSRGRGGHVGPRFGRGWAASIVATRCVRPVFFPACYQGSICRIFRGSPEVASSSTAASATRARRGRKRSDSGVRPAAAR